MNADVLLEHFHRLGDAPDAVPRLRRFILDLAVRGKLVSQDPKEESASRLLEQIRKDIATSARTGRNRPDEANDLVEEDELPFSVPEGWVTTRLASVAMSLDHMRSPINSTERDQRIEGKAPDSLFPYYGATQQQGWIDEYLFDEELVLLGEDGVPFFDDLRPKAYIITGKTWVNNHAHVFRVIRASSRFILFYLNTFNYQGRVAGATRGKLNKSKAIDIPMALPPLPEQHRIVAKVDELMALCDRLEAAQQEREQRRTRLTAASWQALTPGQSPGQAESDPNASRFALDQLPALTTRPQQIAALRQTILDLAVRGRLVKQDEKDEPAEVLLKRIDSWRQAAVAAKEIRLPRKPLSAITAVDIPYEAPSGWEWARLGTLIYIHSGDGLTAEAMQDGPVPVYGGNGVNGYHNASNVQAPTIVIGRVGYYCGSIHVTPDRAWVTDNAFITEFCQEAIDADFLVLLLKATNLKEDEGATAQPVISGSKIYPLVVGLPPLAEQRGIVAKVDELMRLCDALEAALVRGEEVKGRLLEAVLAGPPAAGPGGAVSKTYDEPKGEVRMAAEP